MDPPDRPPMQVLISKPRVPTGIEALGNAHYSYGFAYRNFTRMLGDADVRVVPVAHPERFKSRAYARTLGLEGSAHAHLMFRSTEEIRPIPGAWNIGCFAWEFDVLSGPGLAHASVLGEQTTMLGLCDEVWAPSRFTQRVLEAHGVGDVRFVPSPVFPPLAPRGDPREAWEVLAPVLSCPLVSFSSNLVDGYGADDEADFVALERTYAKPVARQERLARVVAQGGRVFTAVLNPADRRKNLANLIDGFRLATQGRDDVALVIKLITSGRAERPAGYLFHVLRHLLGSPHAIRDESIVLVGGYLTDAQMCALYNGSDFYLCTSLAEGQNAPLLEAVRHGCLPVSTANTAMADYIAPDNAVVVGERRFSGLIRDLAADVSGRRYETDYADRYDVAEAVTRALALDDAAIARMKTAGFAAAREGFWIETVTPRAVARLQEITAALAAPQAASARMSAAAWDAPAASG